MLLALCDVSAASVRFRGGSTSRLLQFLCSGTNDSFQSHPRLGEGIERRRVTGAGGKTPCTPLNCPIAQMTELLSINPWSAAHTPGEEVEGEGLIDVDH